MHEHRSGRADSFQATAVSFLVAGAASAAILVNVSGNGRLREALFGSRDDVASTAPRFIRESAPEASGGGLTAIPGERVPAAATAIAKFQVAAPREDERSPQTLQSRGSSWIRHIRGTLIAFAITGPATQRSNASASVADIAAAAAAPAPVVSGSNAAPPGPAARTARAAYVNYGTTSRSDIMSAGSGPVYNFTGKTR